MLPYPTRPLTLDEAKLGDPSCSCHKWLEGHRELLYQMTKRDVLGRYRGSALGVFWSLAHPVLMLIVYTFVFSVVFTTRWPGNVSDSKLSFAIILFTGMIVFGVFAECVQRAPGIIVSQPNFCEKSHLSIRNHGVDQFGVRRSSTPASSLCVLTLLLVFAKGGIPWTAVFLPVVLLPLLFLTLGLTWFFSALGVYVRDVNQVLGVAVDGAHVSFSTVYPSSGPPRKLAMAVRG